MTSYFLAGKADDPAFARVEYIAKLIREEYPNLSFHMEMKHPDDWKNFITHVFRKYDFQGFAEDFMGPLVWTAEGHLIGDAVEFVRKIYTEKCGLKGAPEVTNPMFRTIAKDNMAEVKAMKQRMRVGHPFEERCKIAWEAARKDGLIRPPSFELTKYAHRKGVRVELRCSAALSARAAERLAAAGDEKNDQGTDLPIALLLGEIGQEHSHRCVLAPEPLGPRHMLLVPRRFSKITKQNNVESLEVLHRIAGKDEDLGLDDFQAGADVLLQNKKRGVCFWLGLSSTGLGLPTDSQLQVLPDGFFPSDGDADGLPYPAQLQIQRMMREEDRSLPMLADVAHTLEVPQGDLENISNPADLAQVLNQAYELGRTRPEVKELASKPDHGMMVAFAYNWVLVLPLRSPKPGSGFEKAASLRMPPPPACALLGLVICPSVEKQWPETAWAPEAAVSEGKPEPLVESKAEVFCIPEGSAEYAAAEAEVLVRSNVLEKDPLSPLKLWGGAVVE